MPPRRLGTMTHNVVLPAMKEASMTRNRVWSAGILVLAMMTLLPARSSAKSSKEKYWDKEPIRIVLNTYTNISRIIGIGLEYSRDSKLIYASGYTNIEGNYKKFRDYGVVFDFRGNRVIEATDATGALQEKYVRMFPDTAWRSYFADFIVNAGAWGFSQDFRYGIRTLLDLDQDDGNLGEKALERYKHGLELWQFTPEKKRLWSSEPLLRLRLTGFLSITGRMDIVAACDGTEGYILSGDTGELIDTFTYGHIETDEEAEAYRKRFRLNVRVRDPMLLFSSHIFSFDPRNRLLACGATHGLRVRVVSMEKPFAMIFEANTDDNPTKPRGGVWTIQRVEFAGRYLIVEYEFGGRETSKFYRPTEIFEIDSWKVVWRENSTDIRRVRLSPDGKKMALINSEDGRDILEIGDFKPEVAGGTIRAK